MAGNERTPMLGSVVAHAGNCNSRQHGRRVPEADIMGRIKLDKPELPVG